MTTDRHTPSQLLFVLTEEISFVKSLVDQSGTSLQMDQAALAGFSLTLGRWVSMACDINEALDDTDPDPAEPESRA
jgi:hypothetical protein